jgi:hypothetical protein
MRFPFLSQAVVHVRQHLWILATAIICIFMFLIASMAHCAGDSLPGSDQFDKLTAAGDLFKTLDSFVFRIGARLLAGLCVLGAGWSLKEQRFASAVICIIAAIVIATVPMWIKNIFDIGGGSIFVGPSRH